MRFSHAQNMAEADFRENFFSSQNTDFRFLGKFPLTIFLLPAFLGIGSLVFSWHKGAKWQCPKSDGARFSKKYFFPAENSGNMPEITVFANFVRTFSLHFVVFSLKNITNNNAHH